MSAKIARLLSTLLKAASLLTVLLVDLYVAYLTQKMKVHGGIAMGIGIVEAAGLVAILFATLTFFFLAPSRWGKVVFIGLVLVFFGFLIAN
ncbi:hypothetical protein ISN75_19870 [Dyella marensis]|uniref:hypothetical protein n=1 Tax=Dyella marensis TaxID=500610 RepID=UPI0031D434CF